ncbi:putative ATP-binding cassette sub-family C member 5 [Blattamonas nauphoetae]|uniref:ATP-binding cassette sub-family C member 5 n=1 Tax=Blattamonas nauphoetae TaxID=2049346 RepID=A0ABQ9X2I3_9EUKA|nr:putative ATP-binding cassette sub-family C member 5 [Blattamonas nauphoetae]
MKEEIPLHESYSHELSVHRPIVDHEEVQRRPNLEDTHSLFLNLFFCFYCPFVCRCKPIRDADIYSVGRKDGTDIVTTKGTIAWEKQIQKYHQRMTEHQTNRSSKAQSSIRGPSLLSIVFLTFGGFKIVINLIIWLISYTMMFAQPFFMKLILKILEQKQSDPSVGFPFLWSVLLILSPFLEAFTDSWANRNFTHFSMRVRSMLSGLIFNKSLNLQMSSRNGVDEGRMLSLMSADVKQVTDKLWMPVLLLLSPLVFFVPLIFLTFEFGITGWVSVAVILVTVPLQVPISRFMTSSLAMYLHHNDTRNKQIKQVLQDMRVVKTNGLEGILTEHIDVTREQQLAAAFRYVLSFQTVNGIVRSLPALVNAATITAFVYAKGITQSEFATRVMPSVGYLTMMTRETNVFPQYIQSLIMMNVSQKRIRQFLMLPEIDRIERECPVNSEVAVSVEDGEFRWETTNDLVRDSFQAAEEKKERKRREKEEKRLLSKQQKQEEKKTKQELLSMSESAPLLAHTDAPRTASFSDAVRPATHTSASHPPLQPRVSLGGINLTIRRGELLMIVGQVGSGKSSLGSAIKGDMECVKGHVKVRGRVAYCAQVPWIANDTIQNNILFGSGYDAERYSHVVRLCQLDADLPLLPQGDQTMIGEKGVNLSGGQKARIQLARAVYADCDVFILDDPLSAVDALVGRALMDSCICGALKGKTVVLITNQTHHLHRADRVVVMADMQISAQGTLDELSSKGFRFDHPETKQKASKASPEEREESAIVDSSEEAQALMTKEEYQTGHVPVRSYLSYFASLFNVGTALLFLALIALTEGGIVFTSFWTGVIGKTYQFASISFHAKLHVLTFIAVAVALLLPLRALVAARAVRRSSRRLHKDLLSHVLRCPTSFFDTTPIGRILNRFSADIVQLDQWLFNLLLQVSCFWIQMIGQIVIVATDTLWFVPVGLGSLLLYFGLLFIYARAARSIQRLDSISRSPVLSVYTETVSIGGISMIRTYHAEDHWRNKFYAMNDKWTIRSVLFAEGGQWAMLWSSIISSLYLCGVVVIGWFFMDAAKLGVAITSSLTFTFLGAYIVKHNVDLDSQMTNFERVKFYSTQLPQETLTGSVIPHSAWPQEGSIRFEDVTVQYRPGLPDVLKNISFDVQPGQKIGICGRTGAGKSSLIYPLFRLVELDGRLVLTIIDPVTGFPVPLDPSNLHNKGRVVIDGLNVGKIPLVRLRRSVDIISQDPVLFEGTVRSNVDVFNEKTDEQIWDALQKLSLASQFTELGLDTPIAESGRNLSAGQRQLLCFVRVLLNDTKIVVLDEATASVDEETDAMIQKAVRDHMKGRTLLVIAHRLNTIMDADKILVMDKGSLHEFASPQQLIDGQKPVPLVNEKQTLASYAVENGSILLVKDLGPQIGYRTLFILEYLAPPLIMLLLFFFPKVFYSYYNPNIEIKPHSKTQIVACLMWIAHYVKRLLETVFVHTFSHPSVPIKVLVRNCAYYWGFAALISYIICHPKYTSPPSFFLLLGVVIFVLSEFMNLRCHLHLRSLRVNAEPGSHPVPTFWPFRLVTCPNYTFEVLSWIGFNLATWTLIGIVFNICGFVQMYLWAIKKKKRYLSQHSDYPQNIHVIIPYCL